MFGDDLALQITSSTSRRLFLRAEVLVRLVAICLWTLRDCVSWELGDKRSNSSPRDKRGRRDFGVDIASSARLRASFDKQLAWMPVFRGLFLVAAL